MYDLTEAQLEMPNAKDMKTRRKKALHYFTTHAETLLGQSVPHSYGNLTAVKSERPDKKIKLEITATVKIVTKDEDIVRAYYTIRWIDTVSKLWERYAQYRYVLMTHPRLDGFDGHDDRFHWYRVLFQAVKDHLAKPTSDTPLVEVMFLDKLGDSGPHDPDPEVKAFYDKYAGLISRDKLRQTLREELKLFRTDDTLLRAHKWLSGDDKDAIDPVDLAQIAYLLRVLHAHPNTYQETPYAIRIIVQKLNQFFNGTIDVKACLKDAMDLDSDVPVMGLTNKDQFPLDLYAPEWRAYIRHN